MDGLLSRRQGDPVGNAGMPDGRSDDSGSPRDMSSRAGRRGASYKITDAALRRRAERRPQAKDGELIGYATEIRFRAERRAGQLLADMAARGERRQPIAPGNTVLPALADLGVTKMQSSRWQKLAQLTEEEFDARAVAAKCVRPASGRRAENRSGRSRRGQSCSR